MATGLLLLAQPAQVRQALQLSHRPPKRREGGKHGNMDSRKTSRAKQHDNMVRWILVHVVLFKRAIGMQAKENKTGKIWEDLGRSGKGSGSKSGTHCRRRTSNALCWQPSMHQHRHDHTGKTESDTQRAAGEIAKSNNDVQVMILQDETEMQTLGGIEPCRERRGWGPTSIILAMAKAAQASLLLLAFPESK